MACQHGCLYCDGRAEKYYVEGQFDRDIVIRPNLPELLESELPRLREKGIISIGSGVSDAYQPAEADEKIMRRCAEVLALSNHPVIVLTKSSLIRRDLDIWSRIAAGPGFMLVVSLVFTDDGLRRIFEPRASTVENRIDLLKEFKASGCRTGVLAMPVMPLVADSEYDIRNLFSALDAVDADFIMPSSLTLRPGRQKETFLEVIETHFPDRLGEMRGLYAEDRLSGVADKGYREELHRRIDKVRGRFHRPFLVPHRLYQGKVQIYDEVNILLHHMLELYSDRGIDTGSLKNAVRRYMDWLQERKKLYNRKRSWHFESLDEELTVMAESGDLEAMTANPKLCSFLTDVIVQRKTFDYVDLRLSE